MPTLTPEQIDDIVQTTINIYGKRSWVDISLPNQFYIIVERFFKGANGSQGKLIVDGGPELEWPVQVANQSNFRWTGLFAKDRTGVTNQMNRAKVKWAMWTDNWSYDVNEEMFQSEPTRLIELLLAREHGMFNNMFDQLENSFFIGPSSSSLDPLPMLGIPHWFQRSASEGFNGGDPSGFATGAGNLLTSTYPRWKNYTFRFSDYTESDLFMKWRRATEFCHFMPPHQFPNMVEGKPNFEFLTTYRNCANLEIVRNARNDNLVDLSGIGKPLMFKSTAVQWVPVLENAENAAYDSTDPIYGIPWTSVEFVVNSNDGIKSQVTRSTAPRQHNVRDVHYDGKCQLRCLSRRNVFVAYKG